jgi:hypothetical protein
MSNNENKLNKDIQKKKYYLNEVCVPKGCIKFNSVEQQNKIFNKKANKNEKSSYYSLNFND